MIRFTCLFLICLFIAGMANAQENAERLVENLSLRLFELSGESLAFSANLEEADALGFYLTPEDKFDQLKICNSDSFSVWLSGQMIIDNTRCYEELRDQLLANKSRDTIYMALISEGTFQDLEINLYAEQIDALAVDYLPSDKRTHDFQEWSVIVLVLVGLFSGLIKMTNPALFAYLTKVRWVTARNEEIEFEFNLDAIIAIFYASIIAVYNFQFINQLYSDQEVISTGLLVLDTGKYVLFLALFLLFKYFFISLIARINALSSIAGLQFIAFIKFLSMAGLMFLLGLQAWYWIGYYVDFQGFWLIENYYLLIYLLFISYFFIRLTSQTNYKKLHIISYLCTTEFIGVFLLALIIYK